MDGLTLVPTWKIVGRLTTLEPLRIGDGDVIAEDESPTRSQVASVHKDASKRAYIPGSSLRGFLRSYFERIAPKSHVNSLFGYQGKSNPLTERADALGGCLTVWDAPLSEGNISWKGQLPPFWNPNTGTAIAAHVLIDRTSQAAADGFLFHEEYVPPGLSFQVTLLLEAGELKRGVKLDDLVSLLLAGLGKLRDWADGAGANGASGWGRMTWDLAAVYRLDDNAISRWLNGSKLLVDELSLVKSHQFKQTFPSTATSYNQENLSFEVSIRFRSGLIVNDSSKKKRKHDSEISDGHADLVAMQTADEKPYIPGSSLHGVLRFQAERIARTLAKENADSWVFRPGERTARQENSNGLHSLDAVSCLFGGVGWRSLVSVSAPTLDPSTSVQSRTQHFVAVDRFTGGAQEGAKFCAQIFEPVDRSGFRMRTTIHFDVARWDKLRQMRATPPRVIPGRSSWDEVLWLLLFTLRDLVEGDIHIGMGAAKGYGACTASINIASAPSSQDFELFRRLAKSEAA